MALNSRPTLIAVAVMAAVISACGLGDSGATATSGDPGEPTTTTPVLPAPTIGPESSLIPHRTLVDESGVGAVYITDLVDTNQELDYLWNWLDLAGTPPDVDFDSHVVLYFGLAESGSCPYVDVTGIVYAEPYLRVYPAMRDSVEEGTPCTADANPHAVVVSVRRDDLPTGEFHLWVDEGDFESREGVTFIAPGELGIGGGEHPALGGDGRIEVGETRIAYDVNTHCGVEWLLRPVNDMTWRAVDLDRTDASGIDLVPSAWGQANDDIDLEMRLVDESTLEVTAVGTDVTVTYTPDPDPPGCD
jgi:hypothetical protein